MPGQGLRPVVKMFCPICGIQLSLMCKNQESNSVSWVLTPSSSKHLGEPHNAIEEKVLEVRRRSVLHSYRKRHRLSTRRRRNPVSSH